MPDERQLSLEVERLRAEAAWREGLDEHVPLAVAAAVTFHQVHGNTKAIVSAQDYDDALNIAATALSRLVPVYTAQDPGKGRQALVVDMTKQRFARGATRLRSGDGTMIAALSVRRADMLSAIASIKRTGLPFSFAFLPLEPSAAPDHVPKDDLPAGGTRAKN